MKNSYIGRRLGFTLASIHAGSGVKLWTAWAKYAQRKEGAFFVFPGGKLVSDKMRNDIYSLVNSENLDGLISWASSVGSGVSLEKLQQFHENFADVPFVTIGQKIEGHPLVEFDAYTGMKQLTEHFIQHHGAKRIVFLRGPAYHTSANDRYKAFVDAVTESGLYTEQNKCLISDPFDWNDGLGAMRQICDERKLRPKKDFDAVIAASDLMAFAAIHWLSLSGCSVPDDILVGGFNNSVESQISTVPFSTVHMPYEELGLEADKLLDRLLNNEKKLEDKLLPTYSIIRESCGCNSLTSWIASPEQEICVTSRQQLLGAWTAIFEHDKSVSQKRLERMVKVLHDNEADEFYRLFTDFLTKYFNAEGEISKLFQMIRVFQYAQCFSDDYRERILQTIHIILPKVQAQFFSFKQFENAHVLNTINTLKSELLSVHNREQLISILERYLPLIGIQNVAIVLHQNEKNSLYVGGFSSSGELTNETILFPKKRLYPERFASDFKTGVFIVQPLFTENNSLGYLIMDFSDCDSVVYEDLRHAISCALQSVSLFEEMEIAKRKAEQAEREKTEFFSNVGSDLCDPLKDLSAKITQMEANIGRGILDADILGEQLIFLKSQIASQLEKTETLVELTRTQIEDIPMDKKLFDIKDLLPAGVSERLKEMPLLFGDAERLEKALQSIFVLCTAEISVVAAVDGIRITVAMPEDEWQRPELLLAERIILLQYGEILKEKHSATIVLPLPTLAGLPVVKNDRPIESVYALFAENPKGKKTVFHLPVKPLTQEVVSVAENSADISLLYWNSGMASIDEWVKLYGLRHNAAMLRMPVLCYDHNLIGQTFMETLELRVSSQKKTTVLFVNTKHTRYGTWATDENSVAIPSMQDFDRIISEITPSLIVFESVTEDVLKKIRQNQKTVLTPILVLPDTIDSEDDVEILCSHPRIILCNHGAAESVQFDERIRAILAGDEILPPHTGALVKKAILYLNKNVSQQIVRWKLADTVHVSEDYLTRIFHKEIGLSLWEYLNRYRIYLAIKMLLETNDTIYEVAEKSGFQDQAYFCRVFKKIYGIPPGKIRTKN